MAEEIGKIALTAINNGAHYNFMLAVVQKAKADAKVYGKVKAQVDELFAAVTKENKELVLSRKSELSDIISEADRQRDAFFRGYRSDVKSFRAFPASAQKTAAEKLWQHIVDYGIDPKMQLDRETGLLTNFIEDLTGKLASQVGLLGLRPFVDKMKMTNDQVRTALTNRDTEHSAVIPGALKASRIKTDEAYLALVKRVNAYAEIEGEGDYRIFIIYVNEQIKRFKQEVLPMKKKAADKKLLAKLIPVFETEQGLTAGSLSFSGHTASIDGTILYLFYIDGNSLNFIWAKIDRDKLVKVNYLAGPGEPGGVN